MTNTKLSLLIVAISLLGAGCDRAPETRGVDETHEGRLEAGDSILEQDGSLYDSYAFEAKAGDQITLGMTSTELDPYLALYDSEATQLAKHDDISTSNHDSRIVFTAPRDDVYTVAANTYEAGQSGAYTLTIQVEPAARE